MNLKIGLFTVAAMAAFGIARPAAAQDHGLHHVQAGALLDYSETQIKILYAAVTAKVYDPKVTKDTLEELKRTLGAAKRHAGRTGTLLPENLMKHEPAAEKLRAAISKAEDQLAKLATDIEEQTKSLTAGEEEVELGERADDSAGDAEPATIDWQLLKNGVGWLNVDVRGAKSLHKALGRKIRVKSLRAPPKPRGKRPE